MSPSCLSSDLRSSSEHSTAAVLPPSERLGRGAGPHHPALELVQVRPDRLEESPDSSAGHTGPPHIPRINYRRTLS